jgi:hypothetical protein
MDREDFIALLQRETPSRFIEDQLFDRIPHIFQEDRRVFADWKRALGDRIEVDPACLTLVGSSATGFSLNPHKNFKVFDESSDVDVAVVSPHHFTVAWRYLRLNGSRRLRVDARTRNSWNEHVNKYIYWGTLATERLLGVLPFGREWLQAASHMASLSPSEGRDVNLRIYIDYDALRAYQAQGVRALRESLLR